MNREPEALGKQRDYYSKAGIFASVKDQLDGNGGGGDKDAVKDTTIAPEWVADKVYKWGELCTYEGELYRPAPAYMENPDTEAFDPTQWYKTSMYNVLKDRAISELIDPKSLAPEYYYDEEEPYTVGAIVCYNPDGSTSDTTIKSPWKLYRASDSDVSTDTSFDPDHWTEISIMEYLEDYYQPAGMSTMRSDISNLKWYKTDFYIVGNDFGQGAGDGAVHAYEAGDMFLHGINATGTKRLYMALTDIPSGTQWNTLTEDVDYKLVCLVDSMINPRAIAPVWVPWAFHAYGSYVMYSRYVNAFNTGYGGYKLYRCDNQAGSMPSATFPFADFTEVSLMDIISSL